ncbi:MAG: carbohydrate kinase, partial [Frankiales bacterium]|nr:carbohydrate kinase [Frankiales bacterium]
AVREHAAASTVDVLAAPLARTAVADATLDAAGAAAYVFDIAWDLEAAPVPGPADWLHVGSIGTVLQPGADRVREIVAAFDGTVSFDPNCRPLLTPEPDLAAVEGIVAHCDVVKLSDEDAAFLLPGVPLEDVLRRWRDLGPRLVVVTRGADGALALDEDLVEIPVPAGDPVVDTVGAGDTFMAGLIADEGRSFDLAATASRVVVSRVGADPPWRAEL